jgi:hypothetical protein
MDRIAGPVCTELLWLLCDCHLILGSDWWKCLTDRQLHLYVESGMLNMDKNITTAAVACFAKTLPFIGPSELHLAAVIGFLKYDMLVELAAFAILEILRLYPGASAFFVERGLSEIFRVLRNGSFTAKRDCVLILCAMLHIDTAVHSAIMLEKDTVEVLLEFLETGENPSVNSVIWSALLMLGIATEDSGHREKFLERFRRADGEQVMATFCECCTAAVSFEEWYKEIKTCLMSLHDIAGE